MAAHVAMNARMRWPEEAPPGFEPGMSDLQSDALATWLRRRESRKFTLTVSTGNGR